MRIPIGYDVHVATDIGAISKIFGIPQYVIRMWQLKGFLSRSIVTIPEWDTLNMVRSVIWDNRNVITAMLRGLTMSERRRLVDTCEKREIERIVYDDFLRLKLTGSGIMSDGRPVTFTRYRRYLEWRHPNLCHLLTVTIFITQRKAALAKISNARKKGRVAQLAYDFGLAINQDGSIVNPWQKINNKLLQ